MDSKLHEDEDGASDLSLKLSTFSSDDGKQLNEDIPLFLGLGSDNFWYAFSAVTVHNMFQAEMSDAFKKSVQTILTDKFPKESDPWEMVGKSGKGYITHVWSLNGSLDTWSWSMNVPTESGTENSLVIYMFPCKLMTIIFIVNYLLNDSNVSHFLFSLLVVSRCLKR